MAAIAPPAEGVNAVTSGPRHKAILRLALPTVVAMLTQSIVNEVDIVFLGHLPEQEANDAQGALLPSLIVLWLFGGSLSAISVGTQAFAARRFAEKRDRDVGAVLANAATFAVVAGAAFTALGYLLIPHLLGLIIKTEGPRQAAIAYLNWRLLGVVSMVTTFAFKAFFDGIGKTHVHLVSAVVMNAANIVLCWLFIFGNDTFNTPRMGIAGAGLAGFVSTYLGLFIMIGYAFAKPYRERYQPFSTALLSKSLMNDILKLSWPSAVATIAIMTGFALFAAVASQLDRIGGLVPPVNLPATTVIVGVLKLTFTACLAFGTSTATLVAQSLGEKKPDNAEAFGWTSVKLGLVIFGVVGFLETVLAPQILNIASPKSPMVQEAALGPMRLMGACTPLIAVGMILTQALFGAGNTRFVMIVELCLHFGCLVPLAYVLGITLGWGLMGVWSAGLVYVLLLAGMMTWKFKSGDWKRIAI